MSGSTGPDQRDLDEALLGSSPAAASPAPPADSLQELMNKATGGGLYPRWENREDQRRPDGQCVVYNSSRGSRCWATATYDVWIGCPHEHVAQSGVCDFHATELERVRTGFMCQNCYDSTGEVVLAYYIKKEPIGDEQREQLRVPGRGTAQHRDLDLQDDEADAG
jgi:hypothetical protein